MKVGIIGKQNAGRSTFFDSLTGQEGAPRTLGKTRLGIARVFDQRVEQLSTMYQPKKTIYAEIVLAVPPAPPQGPIDIRGVREMRDIRAYAHVIGAYISEDPNTHSIKEVSELNTELVLSDMERVETRLARIKKGGGARPREEDLLAQCAKRLETEQPLRLDRFDEQQVDLLNELGLISHRPLLTVINVSEEHAALAPTQKTLEAVSQVGSQHLWLCATLEAEIATLSRQEQKDFLAAYQLKEPVAERFVQSAFSLLNQICFFTVGPDEVRAWPIASNTNARRAARTIHSDLERGFIRAEVVDYQTLIKQGSEAKCKAAGVLRIEGKDYEVKDGDVITIRFNI